MLSILNVCMTNAGLGGISAFFIFIYLYMWLWSANRSLARSLVRSLAPSHNYNYNHSISHSHLAMRAFSLNTIKTLATISNIHFFEKENKKTPNILNLSFVPLPLKSNTRAFLQHFDRHFDLGAQHFFSYDVNMQKFSWSVSQLFSMENSKNRKFRIVQN